MWGSDKDLLKQKQTETEYRTKMSAEGKLAEFYPAHVGGLSIHGQGYFTLYIDIGSLWLLEKF